MNQKIYIVITLCLSFGWFGYVGSVQDYLGCFKSPTTDFDSPLLVFNYAITPTKCIAECKSRYFMYAALMKGEQCYCMSKYGRDGISNGCTNPCSGDGKAFCGSHDSMSVYSTDQKGPSPPRGLEVTENKQTSLRVMWKPPDIPNGIVISYNIRVAAVETHSTLPLLPTQIEIIGGTSDNTLLTNLQPGTKYNISIVALNTVDESEAIYVIDWTQIGPPDKPERPKIIEKNDLTIKLRIAEGSSQNGPLTAYQIVVACAGIIPPTSHDTAYTNYDEAIRNDIPYYVTGEFEAGDFYKYTEFVVGNGLKIGGFYNAPLEQPFDNPQIGVVLVSKLRNEIQYSYSDLLGSETSDKFMFNSSTRSSGFNSTIVGLCVAIALLGTLLLATVLGYFILKRRHEQIRMTKLPEQQELTLQGPMHEVDNMAYIPEDVPERPNHYQDLKSRVWSIPKNFLNIDSVPLRRGRFGTIHTGTVQDKNGAPTKVLVHCISDGKLRASEKKNMLRELDVCIKVGTMNHLAGLVGNCETPDTLYVVLELPPQNLKSRLLGARSGDLFPTEYILPIGSSIAAGLSYLEAHKVLHSHLCARSIGLTDDFVPKIMGFGIGKHSLEDMKLARWTAPERFGHKKHNPAVVWSYGVVIWEMMSMGGTPYSDLQDECDVEEAVVEKDVRLPQLRDMPDPVYEVLLSCWHNNSEERPMFDELMRLHTLSICPITAITEPYLPELELN
ncbi:hypothetical protein PV328_006702 [Microctonus aethiopoides]|uniref:Tyrosine-protein kinase Wsck n=1 Tax=Microctonus aethiopoides TaxID=144406 RepID=A0AA39KTV9_9HYME|nr:hypothetical protein PV328_006702 [Microctonus aethiopoides]